MKKIILLGLLFAFAIFAEAQVTRAKAMKYDEFSLEYTGDAADTLGVADSIWYYAFKKKAANKQFVSVYLEIDSTGGTADTVNIYLQGKAHDNDATYTNIGTIQWSMTGDTIIRWDPGSSYMYKNWRLYAVGENSGMKAEFQRVDFEFRND